MIHRYLYENITSQDGKEIKECAINQINNIEYKIVIFWAIEVNSGALCEMNFKI